METHGHRQKVPKLGPPPAFIFLNCLRILTKSVDYLQKTGQWIFVLKESTFFSHDRKFRGRLSSVQSLSHVRLFETPWTAAIQPSHPLSSPSPPAPNPSQHQGLFQWVSSPHQVARVLEFHLQHQSFQWTTRTGLLWDRLVGSPCSPRDSQESSPTPQLKSIFLLR